MRRALLPLSRLGPRRARACASLATSRSDAALQEHWASLQAFFESAHFGSVQHRRGAELEEALRKRFRLAEGRPRPELQPLEAQVDPKKRVDPVDLMYRWARNSGDTAIPQDALLGLLEAARALLEEGAAPLLDLKVPEEGKMVVVGDTHGQLLDVLHIFHTQGYPSESCTYVFNGDVADRGPQAVEILILILAFKLRFPNNVHLLRGNHENRGINERPRDYGGGFLQECLEKYGEPVYEMFQGIFATLPLFAVLEEKVFVVHAGLFRAKGVTLQQLRTLGIWRQHYPMSNGSSTPRWSDEESILFDAQWGDPHPMQGFKASRRGPGVMDFGKDVTEEFLERNGLSLCIRSHECPRSGRGYSWAHGRRLLTVFSASNYGGVMGNRGAIAVLTRGEARSGVAAGQQLRLGEVGLEVMEHDISSESPESGSAIFRQASLARRVGEDCTLLQPALAILLFHREGLRRRCKERDKEGAGTIPKAALLGELNAISEDLDWQCILNECMDIGSEVAYDSFLDAIHVRWMYSTTEHAARLAKVVLLGELPLEDVTALFGIRSEEEGGRCTMHGLRKAAKLISPGIAQWQLEDLAVMLGAESSACPEDFMARLMLFAPPLLQPSESWMRPALLQLAEPLKAWAGVSNNSYAACRLFGVYAPEGSGAISLDSMAAALRDIPGSTEGLDADGLRALVGAMDANGSGTVSFLELIRALSPATLDPGQLSPPLLTEAVATHAQRNTGVEEFLFSYRGALLRGCRFVDSYGTGLLEPEAFIQAAEALAEVVGQPLSQRKAQRLRAVLGNRLVPYALALSRFEKVLERDASHLLLPSL